VRENEASYRNDKKEDIVISSDEIDVTQHGDLCFYKLVGVFKRKRKLVLCVSKGNWISCQRLI